MISSSLVVLAVQISFSFLIYSLLTVWYVLPRLEKMEYQKQLEILLWVHVFRYLPLLLLAQEQAYEELPLVTTQIIAIGDLISGVLVIITLIILKHRNSAGKIMVWIFSIVSTIDIVSALGSAMIDELYKYQLGLNWFILILYVPIVMISQFLIFRILMKGMIV